MEKTYKIVASTNRYIASRDSMFGGKCNVVLRRGLTLKQARTSLLDLFNEMYGGECYAANWGMAVMLTRRKAFGATPTFSDGTRSFDYDSRTFYIEEEGENE